MSLYFDHAAATPALPEVAAAWPALLRDCSANPESVHAEGRRMRAVLDDAARRLSRVLLGFECPAVWGASGSELLHLASLLEWDRDGHILLGKAEHPATLANFGRSRPVQYREDGGDLSRAAAAVFSLVESETGRLFRGEWSGTDALIIADAVQAAGKIPLKPGADFYLVSGHKLGAPGGAALLAATGRAQGYLTQFKRFRDQYLTGRPEPATALALALAAETMAVRLEDNLGRIGELNRMLRGALARRGIRCTLAAEEASPYILHLILPGYQGAVLARFFSQHGVCLSSGSACQAESDRPSPALLALGYGKRDAYSGLRLSFGAASTVEEGEKFLEIFDRILKEY